MLVCAASLMAAPTWAASSPQPRVAPKALPVPGAFQLPASNGYTFDVIAVPPRGDRSASLLIFVSKKGKGVRYVAPATVTEASIQADLGELGEISVSFHRTNQATSVPCGKEAIRFDSGRYEGKIDFHGEEGYTSVEATSVPASIDYFLSGLCGESVFEVEVPRRLRGAELYVRNPGLGPELSVRKRRPGAAALITAWMSEYTNGISIQRFTSLRVPGGAFTYDRRLRTATVRPPAPFAGSARFARSKKAGQRWSGDLTVDMPGKAGVPLTGPALRAKLVPSG
ncbi:MAG TPA: hypothetical protein VFT79_13060 [Solirubrobacterales bacterium]|nr:hypothetical protein [Solirubrobacterales bacterium]